MNSELQAFETGLSRLVPTHACDRDTLMFRAGQAAATRSLRRWRIVASLAACLAIGVFISNIVWPRTPRTKVVERVVYKQPDGPGQKASSPAREAGTESRSEKNVFARTSHELNPRSFEYSEFAYFKIRRQVFEQGLDALPKGRSRSGPSKNMRNSLDALRRGWDLKG
jgi:hypothetical protein